MSVRSMASVLCAAALVACGYPSYGFLVYEDAGDDGANDTTASDTAGDSAPSDAPRDTTADTRGDAKPDAPPPDTSSDADASPPCPILSGGDLCTSIPKFLAPAQTIDGDGSEFCDVKATKLVATSGAYMEPTPPPSGIDTVVWIRAAWSSVGLHVHVHVDQAEVYSPRLSEEIWRGDAIELFAAGFDTLTGYYDGATHDPGAMQIIAAPPDPASGLAARSELLEGSLIGTYASFAARQVPGGYDVELELLWSDLHAASPASGSGIALDLGVDVRQSASVTAGPLLQSFVSFAPDSSPTGCDTATRPNGHPSCDDKTWCKTKLE